MRFLPLLLVVPLALVPEWLGLRPLQLEDDAYYYFLIAQGILDYGESAAIPGLPSNGYHPLWLGILVLLGTFVELSPIAVRLVEIALLMVGFAILIWSLNLRSILATTALVLVFMPILDRVALLGMETSLVFPAIAFFMGLLINPTCVSPRFYWPLVALATILVVAARLDAIFFVFAILLVAPGSFKARFGALAALGVTLAGYMAVNAALFGAPTPVSGSVKALGTPTFNYFYFGGVIHFLDFSILFSVFDRPIEQAPRVLAWFATRLSHYLALPWVLSFISLIALVVIRSGSGERLSRIRLILFGTLLGFLIYSAKLLVGSSWATWNWYGYPSFILLIPIVALISQTIGRYASARMLVAVCVIFLAAFNTLRAGRELEEHGWFPVNRLFAEQIRPIVGEEPVAMGDRAGSFGWALGTGLFQTEGLINTASYLEHLKRDDDKRPVLCAAGIRFFVSYAPPLEAYEVYQSPVIQPGLSLYNAGYITVYVDEERASYINPTGHGALFARLPNPAIYLWELDCARDQ